MRVLSILVLLIYLSPLSAAELDPQFSNAYSDGFFAFNGNEVTIQPSEPKYTLRARGSRVVIVDHRKNYKYIIDLDAKGEQILNDDGLLEDLKKEGVIGKLLKSISVSDIVVSKSGKRVDLNLHYNISYDGRVGAIELIRVTSPVFAEITEPCEIESFGQKTVINELCARFGDSGAMSVTAVKTEFGDAADRVWQSFLNVIIGSLTQTNIEFNKTVFKAKQ